MTESEIMKELQSAIDWFTEHGRNTNTAICGICERAIDLINRKNAEIDRLKAVEESHREQNGELRKEVEELEEKAEHLAVFLKEAYEEIEDKEITARAEAIKEVLEKVKEKQYLDGVYVVDVKDIDQIAKEMGVEL